jgi:hypothetical protein
MTTHGSVGQYERILSMCDQNEKIRSFEEALLADLADADQNDPAVIRFRDRWDKRLVVPGRHEVLHKEALDKLSALNDEVLLPDVEGKIDPVVIGEARQFIYDALCKFTWGYSNTPQCELDWTLLFDLWKFGPGASNGVKGTHFCDKIIKRMTCTVGCLPLVRLLRKLTPRIRLHDCEKPDVDRVVVVRGSRASSVAKNRDTNRTMAIEPSGNMAFQLAVGLYIQGALKKCGLDIQTQELKNKILAWRGSLNGSLCTIDLSNASDLISIALIRCLWPESWFRLFMMVRSPECKINGTWTRLNMMSTMGNGFTFPMMTLTLLAIIYGYQRSIGDLPDRRVDYKVTGVYGDDIIVPTAHYLPLVEILHRCGLRVNLKKSYSTGPFRESCGGDYYLGGDITPPYVESFTCEAEVYVVINKYLRWSAEHGVNLFRTLRFLRSLLPEKVYLLPEWEDPSQGILSLYPPRRYKKLVKKLEPSVRIVKSNLDLMCLIGGFSSSLYVKKKGPGGDRLAMSWTSREAEATYRVEQVRMPKGFLDGHDPHYGSRSLSEDRWRIIDLIF